MFDAGLFDSWLPSLSFGIFLELGWKTPDIMGEFNEPLDSTYALMCRWTPISALGSHSHTSRLQTLYLRRTWRHLYVCICPVSVSSHLLQAEWYACARFMYVVHSSMKMLIVPGTMSWTKLSPQGTAPSPRAGHTATAAQGKIFIFGGGWRMCAVRILKLMYV